MADDAQMRLNDQKQALAMIAEMADVANRYVVGVQQQTTTAMANNQQVKLDSIAAFQTQSDAFLNDRKNKQEAALGDIRVDNERRREEASSKQTEYVARQEEIRTAKMEDERQAEIAKKVTTTFG